MDFDGIRAEAFTGRDDIMSYIAETLSEYLGTRTTRHLVIGRGWSVAGYRLAHYLITRERVPLEYIEALSQGFLLALHESESKAHRIRPFDEEAAAKLEERLTKLLRLATHEGTGEHEARAAFHGFAKLVSHGEVAIFAKSRVLYWITDYEKTKQLATHILKQNPWLNLWGAKT